MDARKRGWHAGRGSAGGNSKRPAEETHDERIKWAKKQGAGLPMRGTGATVPTYIRRGRKKPETAVEQ